MAAGSQSEVGRLALERARSRIPGLVPDSVEVVELARSKPFVVLWTAPEGVIVLDGAGRIVRGRARLQAVGRHLKAIERLGAIVEASNLERRSRHVLASVELLERERARLRDEATVGALDRLVVCLGELGERLEVVHDELARQDANRPTERTLKRAVVLLNDAAAADRRCVAATRVLGDVLAARPSRSRRGSVTQLRRWVAARLASSDIPLMYPELDALETDRFVHEFVESALQA